MSRVLVTGAAGFVGRHLGRELTRRGFEVVGADLAAVPESEASDAAVPIHALDIRQPERVADLVEELEPDAIIHLAALSSAGESFARPRAAFEVNGLGTLHLLEAVRTRRPRARLVVVSSADIYGPCAPGTRHDEEALLAPVSPYGVSKAFQDLLTGQYLTTYNLDAVRVRPFSHTGPGHPPTFVLPSFAQQIAAIEAGRSEPTLRVGRLDVERDFTDVRDVVACYCEILMKANQGAILNVCRGRPERLDQLLERMLESARVPIEVTTDPDRMRPADLPRLVGDPGRVRAMLGWQAEITMETTLADLIQEARTVQGGG